jgi:RND family efflux transporter MFP subunit
VRGVALAILTFAGVLALAPPAPAQNGHLDCLIQAWETVSLASAVEGLVEKIAVDRGDLVKAGQVLVTLEASVERANVAVARAHVALEAALKSSQARVEFGTRRYDRTLDLFKKELVPLKEMDEAETGKVLADLALLEAHENRRLAEFELQRAEAALALRTIRSPITGVVVERSLAPGEAAGRAPILKLAQIDPLRVEVFAPVAMLGKIRVGMRAQVVPEAPLNGTQTARVIVVDRVVDPASGTFGVRLEVANAEHRLPAGLKCKIRFP